MAITRNGIDHIHTKSRVIYISFFKIKELFFFSWTKNVIHLIPHRRVPKNLTCGYPWFCVAFVRLGLFPKGEFLKGLYWRVPFVEWLSLPWLIPKGELEPLQGSKCWETLFLTLLEFRFSLPPTTHSKTPYLLDGFLVGCVGGRVVGGWACINLKFFRCLKFSYDIFF